jgi:hypothetical protein
MGIITHMYNIDLHPIHLQILSLYFIIDNFSEMLVAIVNVKIQEHFTQKVVGEG